MKLLRAHIKKYGTIPDGRIFQIDAAASFRTPSTAPSRPNSGVPATEVARHAGYGVAVLLKIYAHFIDGQACAENKRINGAPETDTSSDYLFR